ncbi:MAG: S46 family peptidase, partial [Leptospiraceae bacterium]|nr:S46 family peptidase [Leptospiraceae bacterium]
VRLNDGGSGSFVSPNGLILTNHHVAIGQIQKLSTQNHDLLHKGFSAGKMEEEISCPDLEINILFEMKNVTEKVQAAIQNLKDFQEVKSKKDEVITELENEVYQKTQNKATVVTLYEGGEYWLYIYKKITDIRLVFAPPLELASFGGDPDNFQFPRYALDFTLLRAYENNKPYNSKYYFSWKNELPQEGELSFVLGHPGSTDRHKTIAQLLRLRDYVFPDYLKITKEKLKRFYDYAAKTKDNKMRAHEHILELENSVKSIEAEKKGLENIQNWSLIEKREKELRELVKQNKSLDEKYGDVWDKIESIVNKINQSHKKIFYIMLSGKLPHYALNILRYAIELEKPNNKRYPEFRDSNLESWKHKFLTTAPIDKELDKIELKTILEFAQTELGKDSPFIQKAIGDKEISKLVNDLIDNTKLHDQKFRKKLLEGEKEAILKSNDPLIVWMKELEPFFREKRDFLEKEIETPLELEGSRIAKLKFELFGKNLYPDATFTLRL